MKYLIKYCYEGERSIQLNVLEDQNRGGIAQVWFGEICPLGASPHDTDGNDTCV